MISNKNVMMINTNPIKKNLTIDNFEKKPKSGVYYLRCPETKKEFPFKWVGIKERNEVRKLREEINEEYKLRMVS